MFAKLTPTEEHNNREQKLVDRLFDANALYWRDTYKEKEIYGVIYKRRQSVALSYVDGLVLPKTAHVLEIGCGAGLMTTALAERGFVVEAIDHAQAMVNLTLEHARQAGVLNQINACTGDVHELSYEDQSFDLIVALGVIPWLHDPQKALAEMARVTTPNGHIVISMDNALRATTLLDPLTFPLIVEIRRGLRNELEKKGMLNSSNPWSNAPSYRQHSIREFNRNLYEAGLTVMKGSSVGFGPFTFFGHRLLSEDMGIKIHQRLQDYADKGYPFLRSAGSQYIVLASKI